MLAVNATIACLMLAPLAIAAPPVVMDWRVEGQQRQALVAVPTDAGRTPAPVVLVFHGHGGTMQLMARKAFETYWPAAIVVYPQGLPTATRLDPEGKLPGWQLRPGTSGDQDLKFVDAILATLRSKYKVDDARIYATGHSNGGGFTYLLGAMRGSELAAIAPSAAMIPLGAGRFARPLPVMHIAGERDEIVPFDGQRRTITAVSKLNGCDTAGQPWARAGQLVGTLYPSKSGTPLVTLIHPGDHKYADGAQALIVRFFKEHARPASFGASSPRP